MKGSVQTEFSKKFDIAPGLSIGGDSKIVVIAGPCQIESLEHSLMMASKLKDLSKKFPISLVYKSSFDKANRTSLEGKRGPGIDEGLSILAKLKAETGLAVLTDVHLPEQAAKVAKVVDILQTPAFLCRQTDLLLAVGKTGKAVNCKKGQFLHPSDMRFAAEKISSTQNEKIILCERGTSFGYRDLVLDPRSLLLLKDIGYPVVFDATHTVQSMGGAGGSSGGSRVFIKPLIKAAVSLGVNGVFIECHETPDRAPSDGPSMLPLSEMEEVLESICIFREAYLKC